MVGLSRRFAWLESFMESKHVRREREARAVDEGLYVPQGKKVCWAAPYENSGYVSRRPSTLRDWFTFGPLNAQQVFYIFIMNGVGAMIISGAANFGVACAMYRSTGDNEIRVWPLEKNTIAGDMGVTVILQQLATYLITSQLTNFDLRHGTKSLTRPWPPMMHFPSTPFPTGSWLGVKMPEDVVARGRPLYMGNGEGRSRFQRLVLWFLRATSTGSERNAILVRGITLRQRLERFVWTALQGLWWAVLTFWWYWPIAIAIVAPIYEHRDMRGTWIPEIIKLLFGGIMGLITNPFIALFALGAETHVRRFYPDSPVFHEETTNPADTLALDASAHKRPVHLQCISSAFTQKRSAEPLLHPDMPQGAVYPMAPAAYQVLSTSSTPHAPQCTSRAMMDAPPPTITVQTVTGEVAPLAHC